MLDFKEIGSLPEVISLTRNGKPFRAARFTLGKLRVSQGTIRIADAEMINEFPPLPMRVPNGEHSVVVYQWHHSRGPIDVCAIVFFRPSRWTVTRRMAIPNDVRPDLSAGLIVDSGAISIQSDNAITLTAGQGDGYYPLFANYNFGWWLQAVIVDFKIWEIGNVALMPGQKFDEFGIVVPS